MWELPEIIHAKPTIYGWMVLWPEKLSLGFGTDIGVFSLIQAQFGVEIGMNVQIGAGVKIYSISTIDGLMGKVRIQDKAKIGANSVIMPGCFIGEGSVIGALSFLKARSHVHSYELWAGCPAKKKRSL
jgi:carbonic anhydrase/acetyltransferase-like protein (isoleucine patch superfamily)